jgi:SAM-dependent methyltransferase
MQKKICTHIATPQLKIFELTNREIESLFMPFVESEFSLSDPRWEKLVNESKSFWHRKYLRRILLGWTNLIGVKTQENVEIDYSLQWAHTTLKQNINSTKTAPCIWGKRSFLARPYGIKRVHQFLLAKFIETAKPENILEVGSGNGLNLFILSSLFPAIQFSGCELTKGGYEASKQIALEDTLPDYIYNFSPLVPIDLKAHKFINFQQGSAENLPYDDKTFDIVFTVLALEQMEEIRNKALSELSRVSKRYIVMVEPFRDWNNEATNRRRIASLDYFSAKVADLSKYGLRPLGVFDNIPNKLHYSANFLVVEKI